MDIKSKNNKIRGLLMAGIVVLLAALLYRSLYPAFEKRFSEFYTDTLHSGSFLEELAADNFVLYKDLQETVRGEALTYSDLYLKTEKVLTLDGSYYNSVGRAYNGFEIVDNMMVEWEEGFSQNLSVKLDYCAIDDSTGEMIKNTGAEIELAGTEEAKLLSDQDFPYQYYIRVSYDSNGRLDKVSVKSTDSDSLLKKVQSTMQSTKFEKEIAGAAKSSVEGEQFVIETDGSMYEVNYLAEGPKNATFIYALTPEQESNVFYWGKDIDMSRFNPRWEETYAYYQSGADEVYRIFLLVIAGVALLFTRFKKYDLHRQKIERIPVEVSLFLGFLVLGAGAQGIITLINNTNGGYFDAAYADFFPSVSALLKSVFTEIMNVGILFFTFGFWYYLVTALGEIMELGIKEFIKERSLVRRLFIWCKKNCLRFYRSVKDMVLHTDIGEKADGTIFKIVMINLIILTIFCALWFFGWVGLVIYSVLLYIVLRKFMKRLQIQYQNVLDATRSIAEGNLHTSLEEDWGIYESCKTELATIQEGFSKAVEEEVKSQRMRTELITNVSHDLKTPLTAITTYIELLKEENLPEDKRREYVDVLERKSVRLKFLIEDLFEVSKANSRNVKIELVDVDICNLMRQVYLEFEDKVEDADLIFRFQMPEEKVILQLDSQKTYRIFENLYTNIIKYAMPHTRVYVNVDQTKTGVRIEIKNMSSVELNIDPNELTERFVRGDASRNTEGSGLGLAIARSFTELQNGKMEIEIDGDLFKVILNW